jgi:hypothetical protein
VRSKTSIELTYKYHLSHLQSNAILLHVYFALFN